MKPFHAGLLMIGAALAGGLVVKTMDRLARSGAPAQVAKAPVQPAQVAQPQVVAPQVVAEVKPAPAAAPEVAPTPAKPRVMFAKTKPIPGTPLPYQPAVAEAPKEEIAVTPAPVVLPPPVPEPEPVRVEDAAIRKNELIPAVAAPRKVTLRSGLSFAVRLDESLSSERKNPGDTFDASLAEPIVVDGLEIAERGARVTGRVTDVRKAGRTGGTPMLQLGISSITTADGQRVSVYSEPWSKLGESVGPNNAAKIGGGAALGAIIGAIAGGGKGAAIGAVAGGGAGTAAAAASRPKVVDVPSETVIRFRLAGSVTITEREL